MDGDDPPQTDKLGAAEVVKDLLGRGPVLGTVLQALPNQLLHVRPRWTAVVLNVRYAVALHGGPRGERIGKE